MLLEQKTSEIFYYKDSNVQYFLTLRETDGKINTITGTTHKSIDQNGEVYFVKKEPAQCDQLAFLKRLGVNTPGIILRNKEKLATIYAGEPMSVRLNSENSARLFFNSGNLLRNIHQQLNSVIVPENYIMYSYNTTAHIVDCFFFKFQNDSIPAIDKNTYKSYKKKSLLLSPASNLPSSDVYHFIPQRQDLPLHLKKLRTVINNIASDYLRMLYPYFAQHKSNLSDKNKSPISGHIMLNIPDKHIIYGDFKPENLIVAGRSASVGVIDPVISRGSLWFDLAKFTSRVILEESITGREYPIEPFFEGYGKSPGSNLKEYGPYTFTDLIVLDHLNIIKSYFKRFGNDNTYRYVNGLSNERFCYLMQSRLLAMAKHKKYQRLSETI